MFPPPPAFVLALTPLGDWTLLAWLLVAGYLFSAWLCCRARGLDCGAPSNTPPKARRIFWLTLALGLAALGVNKQLDLQTILQRAGKHIVEVQGWYQHRQAIKLSVAAAVGLCALAVICGGVILGRRLCRHGKAALAGCVVLAGFVAVRAAIFQRVDEAVGFEHSLFKAAWLLEVCGFGIVALAAWRHRAGGFDRLRHGNSVTGSTGPAIL